VFQGKEVKGVIEYQPDKFILALDKLSYICIYDRATSEVQKVMNPSGMSEYISLRQLSGNKEDPLILVRDRQYISVLSVNL